jgi:hypothetical protein
MRLVICAALFLKETKQCRIFLLYQQLVKFSVSLELNEASERSHAEVARWPLAACGQDLDFLRGR